MAAGSGNDLLLAVDTNGSGSYSTVAGLQTTNMTLNNALVPITNKGSSHFRELLQDGGEQSISIGIAGVFLDSAAEETVRGFAFSNLIKNYRLTFPNGDTLIGGFQIANYERSGDNDAEERFSCTLESSGTFTFTPA